MNSKMTAISQLSTIEPKNKNKENNQNRNIITEMEIPHGGLAVQSGGRRTGEKCTGNKKHNW